MSESHGTHQIKAGLVRVGDYIYGLGRIKRIEIVGKIKQDSAELTRYKFILSTGHPYFADEDDLILIEIGA